MTYQSITAIEAQQLVEDDKAIIIDVREPGEFNSERITLCTTNIPLSKIALDTVADQAKNKMLIISCQSGRRAEQACIKIAELGNIILLKGGLQAWKDADLETVLSERKVLPLDRQMQIVAGSMALIGVVLGSQVHPAWYGLAALVGAGLLVAGLTGFCAMIRLLSIMPWNRA